MEKRVNFIFKIVGCIFICFVSANAFAQAVLTADGPGNTYERINSVLAPGYNVVEHPECVHGSFGRHIAEVFDADINQYAFEFYAHVNDDNDRCINFDRQRIEIKTYDQSPDSLIGTSGEFVTYKWRFKIPVGFKASSSFTHIHQIKPVSGDDDQPLFTLTVRKGTPAKLELIYVATGSSGTNKVAIVNLSEFEGLWVEATEQILIGANGSYSMQIRRLSDNHLLLNYSNSNIATIRPDNDFIRPKWGIYRSLNSPADLRDESIRFSLFSIKEGVSTVPVILKNFNAHLNGNSVYTTWEVTQERGSVDYILERSADGRQFAMITTVPASHLNDSYAYTDELSEAGIYFYRLRIKEPGITDKFSISKQVSYQTLITHAIRFYPNPFLQNVHIEMPPDLPLTQNVSVCVTAMDGKLFYSKTGTASSIKNQLQQFVTKLPSGTFNVGITYNKNTYTTSFVKL